MIYHAKNFEQIHLNKLFCGIYHLASILFSRVSYCHHTDKVFSFSFQRFVANEFSDEHRKTKKKSEHFPSLILNESLFELKLIDLPVIPFFPTDRCVC